MFLLHVWLGTERDGGDSIASSRTAPEVARSGRPDHLYALPRWGSLRLERSSPGATRSIHIRNRKETRPMSMKETALQFFDACETGKGWDAARNIVIRTPPSRRKRTRSRAWIPCRAMRTGWLASSPRFQMATTRSDRSRPTRTVGTSPPMPCFAVRTRARAGRCRRAGRASRPTTCTSWILTATASGT